MNVTAITANPDSIAATDFTTISCAVQDQESSYAVTGANVSFYRNNTFLGWNLTNATGNSTLTFSINSSGLWNITCIIQNQSNIQYSVGGAPNASTMVNVTNLGPVFIAGINDASDTTNTTNMGELVTFMTGANDPELDEWYLLICGSAGVTAGSCNGFEYCRSGYTSSGANANCSVNTTGYTNRTYPWFAYPCDNTSSCGVSNSATSPFVINHVPIAYPHITPASPTAAQNLTCVINATDPDPGDTVSGNYSWWLRDESAGPFDPIIGQTGSVLPNSQYDSNDQVLCSALPTSTILPGQ